LEWVVTTALEQYRQDFIRLALACNVLQFGEFELKSGRLSPYFFNAGKFALGSSLAQLGRCYAAAIALADHHHVDMPFAFNRKEAKAHGEGGEVVGAPLEGKVLIVDDVMTAGTAIRESMAILEAAGAAGAGVLIGLDRCERGAAELSAVQQVQQDWGLKVISVISLHDIIEWVEDNPEAMGHRDALQRYRDRYVSV
jgi:orotate phosphoribosyltransferase